MGFEYKIVQGNALDHEHNPPGKVVLPHCVNSILVMGSGIARGIAKKWPIAEQYYIDWGENYEYFEPNGKLRKHKFELGETQLVEVEPNVYVANMVGQKNVGDNKFGMPPIRYEAILECLYHLKDLIVKYKIKSVAGCKFGSLRAGGDFNIIEKMIHEVFANTDIVWITYEYTEQPICK